MPKLKIEWDGTMDEFGQVFGGTPLYHPPHYPPAYPPSHHPTQLQGGSLQPAPQASPETQQLLEAIAQLKQVMQQQPTVLQPSAQPNLLDASSAEEYLARLERMSATEIERTLQTQQHTAIARQPEGKLESWLGRQPTIVMIGIYLAIVMSTGAALMQHPQVRQAMQGMFTKAPEKTEKAENTKPFTKPKLPPSPDVILAPPPP